MLKLRNKASYEGMKADFERFWKERLIMLYLRLQCTEQREGIQYQSDALDPRPIWIQGCGFQTHKGKKTISGKLFARLWESCI